MDQEDRKKTKHIENFMKKWYFDTSALNHLSDAMEIEDCIATRELILKRDKQWIISPLNLYEILNTSNERRREKLIYKLSELLPRPGIIFDTPTRILYGSILGYYSDTQTEFERSLRDSWFNVIAFGHTFRLDFADFKKRRDILQSMTKAMNFVFKEKTCIASDTNNIDDATRAILEHLKLFKPPDYVTEAGKEARFYITGILVFAIFCFGVEPDMTFMEGYWNTQKVKSRDKYLLCLSRFEHIILNYQYKILESPEIKLMVDFIMWEGETKGINRGTLADALHLVYSFHACFIVSSDNSLIGFSKQNESLSRRFFNTKDFSFQEK